MVIALFLKTRGLGFKSWSSQSFVCNFLKKIPCICVFFRFFFLGLVEIIQTLYPWPEREDVGFLLVVGLEWSCGKDCGEGDSHLRMGAWCTGACRHGGTMALSEGGDVGCSPKCVIGTCTV